MKTVWVIEDDPDIAEGCRLALENSGFKVQVCRSGGQALVHVQAQAAFDIVILDLHLPGAGGEAILQAIQSRWTETKVLVVTADHLLANMIVAQPQVCEALVKPVSLKTLAALINRYVDS